MIYLDSAATSLLKPLAVEQAMLRALRTMAQTAAATVSTAAVMGDIDWAMTLSATILAGILSMLMSVAGLPEVN